MWEWSFIKTNFPTDSSPGFEKTLSLPPKWWKDIEVEDPGKILPESPKYHLGYCQVRIITCSSHHASASQRLYTSLLRLELDPLKQNEASFTAGILLLTHFGITVCRHQRFSLFSWQMNSFCFSDAGLCDGCCLLLFL